MFGWIAAHWQGLIAALALLVSFLSMRIALKKPVNDWQRELRGQLDQYLHSIQLLIMDTRANLQELGYVNECIQKFAAYDLVLRKLERNITAPRPKLLEQLRTEMNAIERPHDLHHSMLLARKLESLNSSVENLTAINSRINNAEPFARMRYKKRWRVARKAESPPWRLQMRRE